MRKAARAEVNDFELLTFLVDAENVLWFEVTVNDLSFLKEH